VNDAFFPLFSGFEKLKGTDLEAFYIQTQERKVRKSKKK
jgi:hypothetical protein